MQREIVMPRLGADMEEGYLAVWLKKEGERVVRGEPLFWVETDKAIQEVEAEYTGVIENILIEKGETVRVGAKIALVAEE